MGYPPITQITQISFGEVHKELGCGFLEPVYQEALEQRVWSTGDLSGTQTVRKELRKICVICVICGYFITPGSLTRDSILLPMNAEF